MERSAKSPPEQTRGRLTDARASPRRANAVFVGNRVEPAIQREGIDSIHKSACMVAQRKRLDTVDNSPRMVAQRNQIRSMFGEAVQLEDGPDEDELLRGRFGAIQRQGPEYEELRMPGSVAGAHGERREHESDSRTPKGPVVSQRIDAPGNVHGPGGKAEIRHHRPEVSHQGEPIRPLWRPEPSVRVVQGRPHERAHDSREHAWRIAPARLREKPNPPMQRMTIKFVKRRHDSYADAMAARMANDKKVVDQAEKPPDVEGTYKHRSINLFTKLAMMRVREIVPNRRVGPDENLNIVAHGNADAEQAGMSAVELSAFIMRFLPDPTGQAEYQGTVDLVGCLTAAPPILDGESLAAGVKRILAEHHPGITVLGYEWFTHPGFGSRLEIKPEAYYDKQKWPRLMQMRTKAFGPRGDGPDKEEFRTFMDTLMADGDIRQPAPKEF